MAVTARKLSTADERREAVLQAAESAFAERGFHGTPTTAVATAAGISHAYLFRLFPTKNDLAVAVVGRCHDRIRAAFESAAQRARADGLDVLQAMGEAYVVLLQDRTLLLLQLHAHAAAASVPEIRAVTRSGFRELVEVAQRESDAPAADVKRFFATGMLLNVLGALDALTIDEPWAQLLLADHEC